MVAGAAKHIATIARSTKEKSARAAIAEIGGERMLDLDWCLNLNTRRQILVPI